MSDEVVIRNAVTGGEKSRKLARFDLLPSWALAQLAEHYGRGAEKYEDRNWERGYAWSLSFGALQRHAWAFWRGEDFDPETGSHHMAAVAFHALALLTFSRTCPEFDDRSSRELDMWLEDFEAQAPMNASPLPDGVYDPEDGFLGTIVDDQGRDVYDVWIDGYADGDGDYHEWRDLGGEG